MGKVSLVAVITEGTGDTMLAFAIAKNAVRTTCVKLEEENQRSRPIAIDSTHHGGLALLFCERLSCEADCVHSGDRSRRDIWGKLVLLLLTPGLVLDWRKERRTKGRNGPIGSHLALSLALAHANLAECALRRAQVNVLKAIIPDLDPEEAKTV
jgi:hypothetical protein